MVTTVLEQPRFDQAKAEAFSGQLLNALNSGALCLMMSIGHRAGIFDPLCGQAPSTVEQIAKEAGLNDRYVREWLGAMVTAGVVEVDPTSTWYALPAEHAAFLTRAAGADNLAVFTQYIGMLGVVEDEILECFKRGGGVPYAGHPGLKPCLQQRRPSNRHLPLRDLDHALHDVSLAQGGGGLGAMWGEEKTREYLKMAGFRSIETHQLAHDIQNNWYVVRK